MIGISGEEEAGKCFCWTNTGTLKKEQEWKSLYWFQDHCWDPDNIARASSLSSGGIVCWYKVKHPCIYMGLIIIDTYKVHTGVIRAIPEKVNLPTLSNFP
jgi:hypothetical protein